MKYTLILLLLATVAVLGCAPRDAGTDEAAADTLVPVVTAEQELAGPDTAPGTWLTSYDQALKASAELKRPVLINFTGSDWCIWCKKLAKEVFDTEAFQKYAAENLVLLKLDFPQKIKMSREEQAANQKLATQFGVEGFPTIVLVNSDGKEIKRTGYQEGGPEKYIEHLQSLLTQK